MAGLKPIGDIVSSHSSLQALLARAAEQQRLQSALATKLGDVFARNVDVGTIRDDGTLVLVAHSAAWATRLRYAVPDLLNWMRGNATFAKVATIHIQVARAILPREG